MKPIRVVEEWLGRLMESDVAFFCKCCKLYVPAAQVNAKHTCMKCGSELSTEIPVNEPSTAT